MKRTILNVAFDETVSASRGAVLEEAGYAVISTTRVEDALEMMSSLAFDLMIVGHRLPPLDKHRLAAEAKKRGTPLLLICGASADADVPADERVYALEGTAGLVAAVIKLLPLKIASTSAPAA